MLVVRAIGPQSDPKVTLRTVQNGTGITSFQSKFHETALIEQGHIFCGVQRFLLCRPEPVLRPIGILNM